MDNSTVGWVDYKNLTMKCHWCLSSRMVDYENLTIKMLLPLILQGWVDFEILMIKNIAVIDTSSVGWVDNEILTMNKCWHWYWVRQLYRVCWLWNIFVKIFCHWYFRSRVGWLWNPSNEDRYGCHWHDMQCCWSKFIFLDHDLHQMYMYNLIIVSDVPVQRDHCIKCTCMTGSESGSDKNK